MHWILQNHHPGDYGAPLPCLCKKLGGDLEDNDKRARAEYNVNQPVEFLINQIDDSVDIAAAAVNPYLAEQVVTIAYNLVFKTGMFADDCKMWSRRDPADKTWPHF